MGEKLLNQWRKWSIQAKRLQLERCWLKKMQVFPKEQRKDIWAVKILSMETLKSKYVFQTITKVKERKYYKNGLKTDLFLNI